MYKGSGDGTEGGVNQKGERLKQLKSLPVDVFEGSEEWETS